MLELDLRFYKRFDTDLIALHKAGVPVGEYIKMALKAYVSNQPFHVFVPFALDYDFNDRQQLHTSVRIDDEATEQMLSQIKHGYRNSFCKLVLRDAMIYQNLSIYNTEEEYFKHERVRMAKLSPSEIPGTIIATQSQAPETNTAAKILKKPKAKPEKPVSAVKTKKRNSDAKTSVHVTELQAITPISGGESKESSEDLLSIFQGMTENA